MSTVKVKSKEYTTSLNKKVAWLVKMNHAVADLLKQHMNNMLKYLKSF